MLSMVGKVCALAEALLGEIAVAKPVHPFYLALIAGVPLCPSARLRIPAAYVDGIMFFNDLRPGWRGALTDLACGIALREHGLPDDEGSRAELAMHLGMNGDAPVRVATETTANVSRVSH